MTWLPSFYLICFVVGFALTLVSLVLGHVHFHFDGWHGSPHNMHPGTPQGHHSLSSGNQISPINFSTMMAFLTWFGGMGYLLTHFYRFWLLFGLLGAIVSGLGGATVVFYFLVRFLAPRQTQLDPADFDLVGTLARVSSLIRENGTGEIIFSQGGSRKTSGARGVNGVALEKGAEVVIERYEKGIAYVQRWEEFSK